MVLIEHDMNNEQIRYLWDVSIVEEYNRKYEYNRKCMT